MRSRSPWAASKARFKVDRDGTVFEIQSGDPIYFPAGYVHDPSPDFNNDDDGGHYCEVTVDEGFVCESVDGSRWVKTEYLLGWAISGLDWFLCSSSWFTKVNMQPFHESQRPTCSQMVTMFYNMQKHGLEFEMDDWLAAVAAERVREAEAEEATRQKAAEEKERQQREEDEVAAERERREKAEAEDRLAAVEAERVRAAEAEAATRQKAAEEKERRQREEDAERERQEKAEAEERRKIETFLDDCGRQSLPPFSGSDAAELAAALEKAGVRTFHHLEYVKPETDLDFASDVGAVHDRVLRVSLRNCLESEFRPPQPSSWRSGFKEVGGTMGILTITWKFAWKHLIKPRMRRRQARA